MDTTRLITAAFDLPKLNPETKAFEMNDSFIEELDVVSIINIWGGIMPGRQILRKCVGMWLLVNR